MKKFMSILLTAMLSFTLVACSDAEKEAAIVTFKENVSTIEANNESIQAALDSLNAVIGSGEVPLDETVLSNAKQLAQDSKAKIVEVPDMPSKKEDIIAKNEELESVLDVTAIITSIQKSEEELTKSIAQMKQVTNPSEAFVVERLKTIDTITEVLACTEDNDPNGQLHKAGGYTSSVYFTSDMVDVVSNYLTGDSIEKGTDGGGCIEVYENVENAEKRNSYLGAFDGSVFSSGSHTVIGTCVVRTSDKLTASQQKELETNIINALIELK